MKLFDVEMIETLVTCTNKKLDSNRRQFSNQAKHELRLKIDPFAAVSANLINSFPTAKIVIVLGRTLVSIRSYLLLRLAGNTLSTCLRNEPNMA